MNTTPTLLVVTPTLGESVFLEQTLASVAALPVPVLHVLSVPAAKVTLLQARYPHLKVVPDAGKAGAIYGAINAALFAVGREDYGWFTYINDDDVLCPGFGEVVKKHFARANPEPVTYGDVELIDDEGTRTGMITVESNPRWFPPLLQSGISPLMQQGMLFRRDVVEQLREFDTSYRLCADLDFWLRAYASGRKFRYYPVTVAQFRLRSGQLSGNTVLTMREQDEIVARHCPERTSSLQRKVARFRYRLHNLPRYFERVRHRGLRTSYELLQGNP